MNEQTCRELRSFIVAREPSIDRRCRPRPQMKIRLFDEQEEEDDQSRDGSVEDQSDTASDDGSVRSQGEGDIEAGALVYLRFRPVSQKSLTYRVTEEGNVLVTQNSLEPATSKGNIEKHYSFSEIFDGHIPQKEIYARCVGNRINSEENFTVLTYGTSGSGKTFTLLGTDELPGIIPRAVENIFALYEGHIFPSPVIKLIDGVAKIRQDEDAVGDLKIRREILSACATTNQNAHQALKEIISQEHSFEKKLCEESSSVFIWVSFVEIYNENVYDLLTVQPPALPMGPPVQRKCLKVVCNKGQGFVKGLNKIFVKTSEEALQVLRYGLKKVTYASTGVNANSSRSHCIFFVDVLKFFRNGMIEQTSYKFCDLAGSERLDKTGNVGSRLAEAKRINTSLMVLGRCLDAANNSRKPNKDIIPFRESKLTMLIQRALLGKERLTMIVNLTPIDQFYEENLNVLNFASIARNIVFKKPVVQFNRNRSSLLTSLLFKPDTVDDSFQQHEYQSMLEEIIFLRAEIERLQATHEYEMVEREQELRIELSDIFQKTLDEALSMKERRYNAEIAALKRKHLEEIEDLKDEIEELNAELEERNAEKTKTEIDLTKEEENVEEVVEMDDTTNEVGKQNETEKTLEALNLENDKENHSFRGNANVVNKSF